MLDMVKYAAIGWGAISLTWLALMLVIRHVEFSYDEVRSMVIGLTKLNTIMKPFIETSSTSLRSR